MLETVGNWTPEQALLAALKRSGEFKNIVIAMEYEDDAGNGVSTVFANADTKTALFLSEMIKLRALRGIG